MSRPIEQQAHHRETASMRHLRTEVPIVGAVVYRDPLVLRPNGADLAVHQL